MTDNRSEKRIEKDQQLIDDVMGTCSGVYDQKLTKRLEKSMSFCEHVDEQMFLCAWCGWWCDISENADIPEELVCNQCYEDEHSECIRCGETNQIVDMNVIDLEYVCDRCETNEDNEDEN